MAGMSLSNTTYCKIIAFRTAGQDDYLGRRYTKQIRDLLTCRFHSLFGPLTVPVGAGGITKMLRQVGEHFSDHSGINRSGRTIIQIDRSGCCRHIRKTTRS